MKSGENCHLKVLGPVPYEIGGTFKNNKLVYGQTIMPDGSHYEGEFDNLLPHGKGQMKYKDGNDYRG